METGDLATVVLDHKRLATGARTQDWSARHEAGAKPGQIGTLVIRHGWREDGSWGPLDDRNENHYAYVVVAFTRPQEEEDWKCEARRLLGEVSEPRLLCGPQALGGPVSGWVPETWSLPFARLVMLATDVQVMLATDVQSELAREFQALSERWHRDTEALSSITAKSMHPAYQRIIGMGTPVVPLILRELRRSPDHWFWALAAITGDDPVPPEDAGDVQKMTEAWIRLGRQRRWI